MAKPRWWEKSRKEPDLTPRLLCPGCGEKPDATQLKRSGNNLAWECCGQWWHYRGGK